MQGLLAFSRAVDSATAKLGRAVAWLIVLAAVISAGNALARKLFGLSSNAWLELQWWLFGLAFLLAAPWALAENDHIRIDILSSRLSQGVRNWIEIAGHALFLLPIAAVMVWTSLPYVASSWAVGEQSSNFGGLPLYLIKLLIPVAFAILFVQGVSELIKRVAIMRGLLPDKPGVGHPRAGAHEAERIAEDHAGEGLLGGRRKDDKP